MQYLRALRLSRGEYIRARASGVYNIGVDPTYANVYIICNAAVASARLSFNWKIGTIIITIPRSRKARSADYSKAHLLLPPTPRPQTILRARVNDGTVHGLTLLILRAFVCRYACERAYGCVRVQQHCNGGGCHGPVDRGSLFIRAVIAHTLEIRNIMYI